MRHLATLSALLLASASADSILVEAESFAERGGWKLDTQFIDIMGSPYLLAHGLGKPVEDATTTVTFPKPGTYHVWARTKNWVAPFGADGAPGEFQLLVDGKPGPTRFGTSGKDWHWQKGEPVTITKSETTLSLRDVTGFNGRCDALYFSTEATAPDNTSEVLPAWRRRALGISEEPVNPGEFDLVIIGGGYAGSCAAISAARMGIKVALVQNRGVLGGNGSSEVRVWAMGNTPGGLYPVGDIVNEFSDSASKSPGTYEEFEDEKKEQIVRAEDNISLFLHHHAYAVEMHPGTPKRIKAIMALDTRTNEIKRFTAPLFSDCTGHATIGMLAGADLHMEVDGRMGMSNMWAWANAEGPKSFPETPWAIELDDTGFPYPRDFHAQWFWESGYDKHPLNDLELIRDHNLRASYGAWNAIKNKGAYADRDPDKKAHANAHLTWLAYVGGTRETQQLLGDVILKEEDIINKRDFPDGCVLTTWSIDLHYPKKQYLPSAPDNPFISIAVHGKGVNRSRGYPVPYRCFYSRNIDNLFMAGRNVSVTHKALGTVRVMRTCGMMGVVVGKAATLCKQLNTNPRGVYQSHLNELIELMELPGGARRATIGDAFEIPEVKIVHAGVELEGIVRDDTDARLVGDWGQSSGLSPKIGRDYVYTSCAPDGDKTATFNVPITEAGNYEVRLAYTFHENRSKAVPVSITYAGGRSEQTVDMTLKPDLEPNFISLGTFRFSTVRPATIVVSNKSASPGNATVDAVQFIKE